MKGVPFSLPTSQVTVATDASRWVCGTHLDELKIGAAWEPQLGREHISLLKLLAVKYTMLSFDRWYKGSVC